MDYFYVSSRKAKSGKGPHSMTTRELRNKLAELGKSTAGPRHALVKRYQQHAAQEDSDAVAAPSGARPHASENPYEGHGG